MADVTITIQAGPHHRRNCPVTAAVSAPAGTRSAILKPSDGGTEVNAQVGEAGDNARLTWIEPDLAAGASRNYDVSFSPESGPDGVQLTQKPDEIDIAVKGSPLTTYRYGSELFRPHLYPLIGPHGDSVTRRLAKPEDDLDHPHHRSVWVSHGEVNSFNNWGEGEGSGRTVHKEFQAVESGPAYGRILAIGAWVGSEGWKSPVRSNELLEERAEWTFYNTPNNGRIIDLHLTLTCQEMDVLFGDTKEGGLCSVRVEESMQVSSGQGGRITNASGGRNEDETWGKRAAWCDYSGPVNGNDVGVALMDHPASFRHPTFWHVRNYGLMTANPFGLSHFYNNTNRPGWLVLSPGQTLVGMYRIFVHDQGPDEADVANKYNDFAYPPQVSLAE